MEKSFQLHECMPIEIMNIIKSLNPRKGTGPNSIPVSILQLIANNICQPLSLIFNLSFSSGKYPDILKIAKTIPIFKKGSHLLVTNYRPISLLSSLNKILEKLLYGRLYSFLEKHECLYKLQFGFRSKHSTNHALINITESIRKALDSRKQACGIFVDLQKAFDTVNHNILLNKLHYYGIRGIVNDLLASYLNNRSQFVSILGFNSDLKQIHHGVPQGSVLGPLLFLIYINDLHKAIPYSKVYHFADDTNLLNISDNPKQMQKQINIDLKLLYQWLLANKISLNCSKTELLIFHKPGQAPDFDFKIKLNGSRIYQSKSIKYLGIYLDSTLSGRAHCEILIKKLRRANGMLTKVRHYVPKQELKSIYYAIFSSHLYYGLQIWGQRKTSEFNKLIKLKNRALRIKNFENFEIDSSPLFKESKIIKLENMVDFQNCLFLHDYLNNRLPKCFNNYFKTVNNVHSHSTHRSRVGCIYQPRVATKRYGQCSIISKCIKIWNEICLKLKFDIKSLSHLQLKSRLTTHFLNSY